MSRKDDLKNWVYEAVRRRGEASVLDVAKDIWHAHEAEIHAFGDGFYTWQYDMRWAAQDLRAEGKLVISPNRKWALSGSRI
ncbi:hypothetical protein [Paradevosia shaoguanensis]|uniref:hypothetical protein n=1 Tax=Paradevosia shaoguanensis TaxID=1335043 RepID=UPI003C724A51